MSGSREQSYYEIALTNGQVRTIFAVLLIFMVAAFLAGVWVGRDNAPIVSTVEPEAITAGVDPGSKPLEELDFFSRREMEPQEDTAVEPPVREKAAPSAPVADEPQPVIIEEVPTQERPTQEVAARSLVRELSGAGDAEPARNDSSPAAEKSAAQSGTRTAAGAGALVVQVFSSTDEAQARQVLEKLQTGGYPALLSPVDVDGRPMFRVRVGPYMDRDEAQAVADRVRRAYKLDTWITR
ncbi:MAG: SPOR domain-containing protein [Acidobacteriota bacterium]|nr:SPOR domain-containing protein [Acidobacteriota bacterium]